jgi:quercetin dioxygenase-like cupin family protein
MPDPTQQPFPAGTVLSNPVSGEWARLVEHTRERAVAELLAIPGGAVPAPHRHPAQTEHFEVLEGVLGYRRGKERGELRPGGSLTVPPGIVHDWWNAGDGVLRALVTVTPPGRFAEMIGAVWGLGVLGRTDAKGKPRLLDAALLLEAFGDEIVFEKPPAAVQKVIATVAAPLARARGRSVAGDDVLRAAIVDPDRWPDAGA